MIELQTLHEHMQDTISIPDGFTIGTLIIENERVLLATKSSEIQLNDSFQIEVRNGTEYVIITEGQALNAKDSLTGFPLFAGLDAPIKLKNIEKRF